MLRRTATTARESWWTALGVGEPIFESLRRPGCDVTPIYSSQNPEYSGSVETDDLLDHRSSGLVLSHEEALSWLQDKPFPAGGPVESGDDPCRLRPAVDVADPGKD